MITGDDHGLYRMLSKSSGEMNDICLIERFPVKSTNAQIPGTISAMLEELQDVFEEPKGLPPRRACDHTIPLISNTHPLASDPMDTSRVQEESISTSCCIISQVQPKWVEDICTSYEDDTEMTQLTSTVSDVTVTQGLLRYKGRISVGSKSNLRQQLAHHITHQA